MISKMFSKLSGRTTAFCSAFFVSGNILHWLHRLDSTYITFMVALLGAVIGHSVKEDLFASKPADPAKGDGSHA
jgi:hypothetical protein